MTYNVSVPTARTARRIGTPVFRAALSLGAGGTARAFYDFASLAAGSLLDGQDGWRDERGQGGAIVVQDLTLANGSRVVQPLSTLPAQAPTYMSRVNDARFGFKAFTGIESRAILQFDATGEGTALFALGHATGGSGRLERGSGEIGPAFGIYRDPLSGERFFRVQGADMGFAVDCPLNGAGCCCNAPDDWYRIQLRMDFNGNGGGGTGSLHYLNLSNGDLAFQPLAALHNVPLELERLDPAAGPETWDALWLHLHADGHRVPSVDNLGVPRVAAVVQPDFNLFLQPVDVFGRRFDVMLEWFVNRADPNGLYWRLAAFEQVDAVTTAGAALAADLSLDLCPMDVGNRLFDVSLEPYENPEDPDGRYWRYVPGTAVAR